MQASFFGLNLICICFWSAASKTTHKIAFLFLRYTGIQIFLLFFSFDVIFFTGSHLPCGLGVVLEAGRGLNKAKFTILMAPSEDSS